MFSQGMHNKTGCPSCVMMSSEASITSRMRSGSWCCSSAVSATGYTSSPTPVSACCVFTASILEQRGGRRRLFFIMSTFRSTKRRTSPIITVTSTAARDTLRLQLGESVQHTCGRIFFKNDSNYGQKCVKEASQGSVSFIELTKISRQCPCTILHARNQRS